eukprot:TRINITY_DN15360_c0_g1_i1.p2 TRINITY_DN15360_c0_g1~~TRINITY_DN15360_c0_g1_i1.p2  ORF type:complete len:128 (-),score=10.01 TRINITY_DN15360_c0_g1_i1:46-429(-)
MLQNTGIDQQREATLKQKIVTQKNAPEHGDRSIKRGNVEIKNCDVKNAPQHGIVIDSCNSAKVESVKIDGCRRDGIHFCQADGELKSSTISNCSQYGVNVSSCTVKGHQVQFNNNKNGNTNGNYVQV